MALVQKQTLERILVGVAGSAVIGGGVWLVIDWLRDQPMGAQTAHVREIVNMLDLTAIPDFHQRLDKVRTFINDHSVHKIDAAFWVNHGNPACLRRRRTRSCERDFSKPHPHGVQHAHHSDTGCRRGAWL